MSPCVGGIPGCWNTRADLAVKIELFPDVQTRTQLQTRDWSTREKTYSQQNNRLYATLRGCRAMTDGPERPSGRSRLQKQAIEEDTSTIELVENLDFGFIKANDQYADWHASTPLLPMVRVMILKEIEDYSFTELHRYVDSNPVDAEALGFEDLREHAPFAICRECGLSRYVIRDVVGQAVPSVCEDCQGIVYETEVRRIEHADRMLEDAVCLDCAS